MADITAIILTRNEEINIGDCIKSIASIARKIVVVDSFSDDKTLEIAKSMGGITYQHEFENHARQYRYAIEAAQVETQWILRIDADERLTKESAQELQTLCEKNRNTNTNGIIVRFKQNFMGKDLYHGGVYPWKKLICYKAVSGFIEDRNMDEHIVLTEGKTVEMKTDSLHLNFRDLTWFINKFNWYSTREVIDYFEFKELIHSKGRTNKKTWIKMNLYYRLPMGFRAWLFYMYRYYMLLGFLDGKEGKIYHFLHAYWYRFLVDAKIYEHKKDHNELKKPGVLS